MIAKRSVSFTVQWNLIFAQIMMLRAQSFRRTCASSH